VATAAAAVAEVPWICTGNFTVEYRSTAFSAVHHCCAAAAAVATSMPADTHIRLGRHT